MQLYNVKCRLCPAQHISCLQMAQYCRAVMAEVTVAFKVCSEAINAAEAGLRELQQLDLADMLRVVQHNEQEKLRLTLILQALRQSSARGQFSWQGSSQAATTDALQSPGQLVVLLSMLNVPRHLSYSDHDCGFVSVRQHAAAHSAMVTQSLLSAHPNFLFLVQLNHHTPVIVAQRLSHQRQSSLLQKQKQCRACRSPSRTSMMSWKK